MRRERANLVLAVVVAIALATQSTFAVADQNDPRLDRLFSVLHSSNDARELDLAEGLIWDIWATHDDIAVSRLMLRGMFAASQERYAEALRMFDQAIRIAPEFAEAWNKRATIYFLMGEFDKSRADVARTLELEPRHFGALSGLGQIELQRGDRERALKAFEYALEANPHLVGARTMADRLRAIKTGREL